MGTDCGFTSFTHSYIMDLEKSIEEAEQRGIARRVAHDSETGDPAASHFDKDAGSAHHPGAGRLSYARATSDAASVAAETHSQGAQPQARGASPQFAYPTPALGGPECRETPRPEQREDSDRESSAIDNPLALRHPEFTTSAEGTSCTCTFIPLPPIFRPSANYRT